MYKTYELLPNFPTHWFKPIIDEWFEKGHLLIDFHKKNPKGRFKISENLDHYGTDTKFLTSTVGFNKENLHIGVRKGISNGTMEEYFDDPNEFQKYVDFVKLGEGYCTFNLFVAYPGRVDPLHIDSSRECAINFAVDVDHDKSYFRIAKDPDLSKHKELDLPEDYKYPKWRHYAHDNKARGHFDEDAMPEGMMQKYNLESPVIFNCKTPHGGANLNDKIRTIFSVGFRQPKEKILQKLPIEWQN